MPTEDARERPDTDAAATTRPDGASTQVVAQEGAAQALMQQFRITVIEGADAGKTIVSDGQRLVVGTHESADLVLHDPTVSRFHCELGVSGDKVLLRDLGSSNGTFLNGTWTLQAYLRSGAVLSLGNTRVRFDLETERVRVAMSEREEFGLMVARSVAMRAVFARLERAAATDVTVLLEGETGTGKEAAAASIHRESARREGPFVVVDCGAIPADLLESELFGHERGAFTGAIAARKGAFETASGGTIFLDEIGELGADLQPKLLRALEQREIKRVGGAQYFPVDVRVIAATNRNLRSEVNAKKFRADLYYRLAVLEIRLPPLRERAEDLPMLVENILAKMGIADSSEADIVRTPEFQAELARHSWPGNVRELRNYVERCIALREQPALEAPGFEPEMPIADASLPLKIAREVWTKTFEKRYLEDALRRHDDNVRAAARAAGVNRMYFYRLLWRHGLR